MRKPPGKTKDAGYQFGIRKSFPVTNEQAWKFMFSRKGIHIWLGRPDTYSFQEGTRVRTAEGIEGTIKVFTIFSHIRMTWKKPEWNNFSRLQIRVIPGKGKTTISIHQEMLNGSAQRAEMKNYWSDIMGELSMSITSEI
jgi:hypothetical protein